MESVVEPVLNGPYNGYNGYKIRYKHYILRPAYIKCLTQVFRLMAVSGVLHLWPSDSR